jgi:hypothetical protein
MGDALRLDLIEIGNRYRRDLGDIHLLAKSIGEIGLLHPVVVTADHRLIAGQRRIMAVRSLGWTEIPVRVIDLGAVVVGEHDENEMRKSFTVLERQAIADAVRQELGDRNGARSGDWRPSSQPCDRGPEVETGRTSDIAAKRAGFSSGRQLDRVELVMERGAPELIERMDRGEVSITGAAIVAKQPLDVQERILAEDKFDKAVSNLRNAEKAFQEAKALPKPIPLTDEERAKQREIFGTPEDRAVLSRVDEILERIKEQPDVASAVKRVPPALQHTIQPAAIREAAQWLIEFANQWENEHGLEAAE